MKKLKINFGEGGISGWLARHVEKFVLGLFIGVMVWFVYQGYSLKGLDSAKRPDALKSLTETVRTIVNEERWDKVKSVPERTADLIVRSRVGDDLDPKSRTDSSNYLLLNQWDKPLFRKHKPRTDPQIYPPQHLKVVGLSGAVALKMDGTESDPLDSPAKEEDDKPRSRPRQPERRAGGAAPTGSPMGPAGGRPGARGGAAGGGPGAGGPAMPGGNDDLLGGGDGAGVPGPGGMQGGPGRGAAGGNTQKVANEMVIGYQPPQNSIVKDTRAVVVMAVVPYEKQIEEYDRIFMESLDYDPDRDKPRYLFFGVERADVTDNPTADPASLTWTPLKVGGSLDETQDWAGYPKDIVDPAYLMPTFESTQPGLTHPVPPFVQRDLWEAMTHPDIPVASVEVESLEDTPKRRPRRGPIEDDGGEEIPIGGAPRAATGVPGGGSLDGDEDAVASRPGSPGGGGRMPGGAGGMPGGAGNTSVVEKLVKFKLIRFTDTRVEAGKLYRYRVRVTLEDPNRPASFSAPALAGLDEAVRVRIKQLEEAEAASGATRPTTHRWSDWSTPSDVVSLPPEEWFYAGKVEPDPMQILDPKSGLKYWLKEPTATALTVVQDPTKNADIPAKQSVWRGSTLNFTKDVDLLHPVLHELRKLEKYSFHTNAVVADIRGGERMPLVNQSHDGNLYAPGEILIVDSSGNMHVQDESIDIDDIRRFEKAEPATTTRRPKPGNEADDDASGGFGGIMGGTGMPGGGGMSGGMSGKMGANKGGPAKSPGGKAPKR